MKTLITLSTILAAGTLAVNAATTLVWYHYNNDDKTTTEPVTMNEAFISGATETINISGANSIAANTEKALASGISLDGTANKATLSISSNSQMWNAKNLSNAAIVLGDAATKLSAGTGITLGSSLGNPQNTSNTNGWGISGGNSDSKLTLKFSNLQASKTYAFTLLLGKPSDNTNASAVSLTAGTFVSDIGSVSGTDGAGTLSEAEFGNYNYIVNLANGSVSNISSLPTSTFNSGSRLLNVLVTTNSSGMATFQTDQKLAIAAIALTTIPEPSAFGLLAGIGALALAGTRRRRKMR